MNPDTHNGGEWTLDVQTAKIHAQAIVLNLEMSDVIVEAGPSAADRAGFLRLLTLVDAGVVGTVITARLDRLARSVFALADLFDRFDRSGVALVSVAEELDSRTSEGRQILRVVQMLAEWEREATGERTRDALHHKRTNGERIGNVPFGQQLAEDGIHLEPDPREQRLLARMRALEQDGRSIEEIADHLNRQGFTTRRGTRWRYQHVANILRKRQGP